MDLTEPENRTAISYGTSRFQGSDAPGPSVIRMFDGHIQPFKVERQVDFDEDESGYVDLSNTYCCDCGENHEY